MKTIPKVKDNLFANLRHFKHHSLNTMIQWQQEYGDIVEFDLGFQRFYLLSHAQLVEQALVQQSDVFVKMYNPDKPKGLALILGQGLLTSQGELWRKQRQLIQPMLQKRHLAQLLPQMQQAGKQMLQRWQQLGDAATIDVGQEMLQLALEVITQTMFSTSVLEHVEKIAPALDISLKHAARTISNPFIPPLWLPTPSNLAFKQARDFLDGIIYGMVEQRRQQNTAQPDLLNLLLNAEDNGEKMSDKQIRDEVITIFTAGHETTANALTWTLFLLSQHPEVVQKLQQELDEVLNGQIADNQSIPNLIYTRAVLNEAMRLYPPAGILMRRVSKDTELNGYALKKGSLAIMCIYNIHHQALWQQPEHFRPERFLSETKHKFSHIPFGIGARMCVGNQFALFEMTLLLSMMVQRYDFKLLSSPQIDMDMNVSIRPKQNIMMQLMAR